MYQPASEKPTPTLDQIGIDLTKKAENKKLNEIIGRDEEIGLIIETLCRRTKKCPILVGPAGVGKSAVVEGLAQRIVRGDVPESLSNSRIFALKSSLLLSSIDKEQEDDHIESIITEANLKGIILFIDEAHFLSSSNIRTWPKEFIDRITSEVIKGSITCIAAESIEYFQNIPNRETERCFQPIRVCEPSLEISISILSAIGKQLESEHRIIIDEEVYPWLVDFASKFIRNRYFPDKSIDLLEQCASYAVTQNKAAVKIMDAMFIIERLVGFPPDLDIKLEKLRILLSDLSLLVEDDIENLLNRLNVTMRGLDIRPFRPNIVVLLTEEAKEICEILASVIAESLYGDRDRIALINSDQLSGEQEINWFLGHEPMLDNLHAVSPLYEIDQIPWCVVLFKMLQDSHPYFVDILCQALERGYFVEANRKRIYLSDAVVLISANINIDNTKQVGFPITEGKKTKEFEKKVETILGKQLIDQVDLVCMDVADPVKAKKGWLEGHLLEKLSKRYAEENIKVSWDNSFIEWLLEDQESKINQKELERIAEQKLSLQLIQNLPNTLGEKPKELLVIYEDEMIRVQPVENQEVIQ